MCRDSVFARSVPVAPLAAALLVALFGCATPLRLQIPTESHVGAASSPGTAAELGTDSVTIQVRYFSYSPTVSVLAWRAEDPGYGLRAQIRSDGSLVRDHVLYVSASYQAVMPQSPRAMIPSRPLEASSGFRDDYACHFGECSPFVTLGARIPDDVLRAARESIPVRFYEDAGARRAHPLLAAPDVQGGLREITITVDPALITAYLAMVDSVSAELRKRP